MNDTVLLITGISVFGLMSIAVILTVMEFNSIRDRRSGRRAASQGKTDE
ncbi:MAG: hypothetical protein HKO85_08510 [Xanthomonadales bacterium]|nr:hypothetical protein [Gammaproteobacteria bacterium]MBT8050765.1 hypothetical protein [Gammaproteobacteria bacterium]MBT8056562.1 hypothetical protein [Gammaproteobacteria bacterium]NNJ79958.1 hypothetical protein [Xanthomonadales bacterium]NNL05320.1 hypothetical protein [Xanthomonadales bacterium]